jgi:transposase
MLFFRLALWRRRTDARRERGSLFSYVDLEGRVGKAHPLRIIRGIVNEGLAALSGEFSALDSRSGRPSIPPQKLLRAMLLPAFSSIRSERQLMERLEFDLLFRGFIGIGVDDAAWDHSTFSKNRERLLEGDIAAKLLSAVRAEQTLLCRGHVGRGLGVDEELSAEGRLGRATGFGRREELRDGFPRSEALQRDARFDDRSGIAALSQGAGQGGQALLHGAALMENRNGLVVDACLTEANGHAERIAALHRIEPRADRPRHSRSAPTRPTTPRTSSMNCGRT